ncbi:MAG: HAD family hydrolase [Candidatus Latescibacteria bacterium]|nr:HAD family hydrolase [Candidatus Latescibacterota bacterium]
MPVSFPNKKENHTRSNNPNKPPLHESLTVQFKGIFFDLFGTLFIYGDMKAAWADWLDVHFKLLIQKSGSACSKETLSKHCDGIFSKGDPPHHPDLTIYERRIQTLCDALNLNPDPDTFQRATLKSIEAWQVYVPFDPDVIPVLQQLKRQYTLGLISNFDHAPYVRKLLSDYNLSPLFDTIVISGDIEINKPDPRIFHHALKKVDLQPDQAAYVGDSETDDIQGALNTGLYPIWINREDSQLIKDYNSDGNVSPPPSPNIPEGTHTISKLTELLEFLD